MSVSVSVCMRLSEQERPEQARDADADLVNFLVEELSPTPAVYDPLNMLQALSASTSDWGMLSEERGQRHGAYITVPAALISGICREFFLSFSSACLPPKTCYVLDDGEHSD